MNEWKFEIKKIVKSRTGPLFLFAVTVCMLLYLIINLVQLPIERQALENRLLNEEETLAVSIAFYQEETESGNEEYAELYAQASESIKYLRESRNGLNENNDEAYLSSYISYVKSNNLFNALSLGLDNAEELEFSDYDRNILEEYQALLDNEDPYEVRNVSLRYPYFPVYTLEFLFSPLVFVILLFICQFILVNEYDFGSYRFALVESNNRVYALLYKQLSTLILFGSGLLFVTFLSSLISKFIDRPFIGQHPSTWGDTIFTLGADMGRMTLLNYSFFLILSGLALFFLFSLFFTLLISYVHSPIVSGLIFLLSLLSGSFLTYAHSLNVFFNPFSLFYLEELVLANGLVHYSLVILSTFLFSGSLVYLISKKSKNNPL